MGDRDPLKISTEGDQGNKGSKLEHREVLKSTNSGDQVTKENGNQSYPINGFKSGSWVKAVQGKNVLKKYDMEIQMKDGIGSINVPDEVLEDSLPLWEDFLIGRFLDKAPHIAKVHAIVNKIWALSDKTQMIDVYEINSTTMKFKISNPVTRNRIIKRAMWNIAEIPVVMAKWSPLTEDIKQETHSIPLWVHLRNVPMDMFSWNGLSFVSSPVGVPVRLHPETEQCLNLKVAKIFVKVDLSKEVPKSMNFTIKGKETLVEYSYPWLPLKCTNCAKWGHLARVCRGKRVVEDVMEGNIEDTGEGTHSGKVISNIGGVEKKSSEEISLNVDSGKVLETNVVVDTIDDSENASKVVNSEVDTETKLVVNMRSNDDTSDKVEEQKWVEISPGKASHTPTKSTQLKFGQVSLLSKSRFSVLSMEEEEGEIIREPKENEEVNKDVDKESESEESDLQMEEERVHLRQYLPRGSKNKHKFLNDVSVQRARDESLDLNKKKKPRKGQ
ncbi:hypothetical protein Bca4012_038984 [Brassica carinata]